MLRAVSPGLVCVGGLLHLLLRRYFFIFEEGALLSLHATHCRVGSQGAFRRRKFYEPDQTGKGGGCACAGVAVGFPAQLPRNCGELIAGGRLPPPPTPTPPPPPPTNTQPASFPPYALRPPGSRLRGAASAPAGPAADSNLPSNLAGLPGGWARSPGSRSGGWY